MGCIGGNHMERLNTYTKIVATIGPASESYETIKAIIQGGARVIRLNFSHGTASEQQSRVDRARKASVELGIPIAVFQDLQGPKIRISQLAEPFFVLERGDSIILTTEPCVGTKERIGIDYPFLHEEISPGCRILIDDGLIALTANKVVGHDIHCTAVEGGVVKPRKGVNLPGVPLRHLSSFTPKDEKDLSFAFENNLDYVALSFVRSPDDLRDIRAILREAGAKTRVVSKIERPEALEHFEEIVHLSDAIMVARGDLGVEMPFEEVPIIQKRMIRTCNELGVSVITATQMLESMTRGCIPSRPAP